MKTSSIRFRILTVVLAPLLLGAALSIIVIMNFVNNELNRQADQYGQSIADQLAATSIDYLVSNDVLSLNVLLDNFIANRNFNFAAVYNPDNQLLAQSGQRSHQQQPYSKEINFQNSNLGYVSIELDSKSVQLTLLNILIVLFILHLLLIGLLSALIWHYCDLIYLWLTATKHNNVSEEIDISETPPVAIDSSQLTVLVLKIRPARLIPTKEIDMAFALYGASIEQSGDEEWLLSFDMADQLARAISCGLLVKSITELKSDKLNFKGAIDQAAKTDLVMLKKQAIYLASMSDQNLLLSQQAEQALASNAGQYIPENISCTSFHSALSTDSGIYEVFCKDSLFKQQAKNLLP